MKNSISSITHLTSLIISAILFALPVSMIYGNPYPTHPIPNLDPVSSPIANLGNNQPLLSIIADAGPDQKAFEGQIVQFDGTKSIVSMDIKAAYEWDYNDLIDTDGDGNFSNDANAIGPTPTHVYGDNGNYTVTLTLRYSLNSSIDFNPTWMAEQVDVTYDIALGDLDEDGDLDFIAANSGPNRIYMNDGTGEFILFSSSDENDATASIALGDLDGDGDLDYIAGNCVLQPSRIYLNDGEGNFSLHSSFNSALSPGDECVEAIAVDDLNKDGDLDFIIGTGQNNVLFSNDGNGNFTELWATLEDDETNSIDFGDIDNDGDLDQLVGNIGPNRIYKNDGTGNFPLWTTEPALIPTNPPHNDATEDAQFGDLDNDGDIDYITGNAGFLPATPKAGSNRIWLNDGFGNFTNTSYAKEVDHTRSIDMGDLDNDGDIDYITGSIGTIGTGEVNRIYLNDGNAQFSPVWNSKESEKTWDVELGDLDGDGDLDIIAGNLPPGKTRVYMNNMQTGLVGVSTDTAIITIENVPPMLDSLPVTAISEGQIVSFMGHATDPGSDDLNFAWTWESRDICNMNSTYLNAPPNQDSYPSPEVNPRDITETTSCAYGDNGIFNVTLTVTDDDGGSTSVNTTVIVSNVAPSITNLSAYTRVNITLRLAGEKWHDATMYLYVDSFEIGAVTVVRYPGSPNDQSATIEDVYLDLTKEYSAKVVYTPDDDPVNGQPNGASPAWIVLAFEDGSEERIHHTFNVQHPETWEWSIALNEHLVGHEMTFEASASDPGSDDLRFSWDWDDGAFDEAIYYSNAPVNTPDPYPSPEVNPRTVMDTQKHVFCAKGTYDVVLTVRDDDGGESIITVPVRF